MTAIEIGVRRPQLESQGTLFQEWTFPDGRPWTRFHRLDDGFLLRFPGLADFELDKDATEVRCFPAPSVADETVWHLYHNQVLPLALSRQGKLVFHASAVDVDGGAVAFLGASGKGKSTLAASLALNGFPFLTDDGLLLERRGQDWLAMPSQPSVRLWNDSQMALVGEDAEAAPALEFTSKGRFLAGAALNHCSEPRRLKCIYLLGDGSMAAPAISRLTPGRALIELVKHSFLLDIDERQMLAAHFDELSALLARVPCKSFDYPRSFPRLAQARESLLGDVSRLCLQ